MKNKTMGFFAAVIRFNEEMFLTDSRFSLLESFHFVGNSREVMNEQMDLENSEPGWKKSSRQMDQFTFSSWCRTRLIGSSFSLSSSSFSIFCWRSTNWCKLRTALKASRSLRRSVSLIRTGWHCRAARFSQPLYSEWMSIRFRPVVLRSPPVPIRVANHRFDCSRLRFRCSFSRQDAARSMSSTANRSYLYKNFSFVTQVFQLLFALALDFHQRLETPRWSILFFTRRSHSRLCSFSTLCTDRLILESLGIHRPLPPSN